MTAPKVRRGFTLVEVIVCILVLAITVLGISAVGRQLGVFKTEARNNVALSLHNLNVAEQLRQQTYDLAEGKDLRMYYGPNGENVAGAEATDAEAVRDPFSTEDIITEVYVNRSALGKYRVYSVRIESRIRGYYLTQVSNYTLTDIGRVLPDDASIPEWIWDEDLEDYVPYVPPVTLE